MRTVIVKPSSTVSYYGADLTEYIGRVIDLLIREPCFSGDPGEPASPDDDGDDWVLPKVCDASNLAPGADCVVIVYCSAQVDWKAIGRYIDTNKPKVVCCVVGLDGGGNLVLMGRSCVASCLNRKLDCIVDDMADVARIDRLMLLDRYDDSEDKQADDGRWNWWGID